MAEYFLAKLISLRPRACETILMRELSEYEAAFKLMMMPIYILLFLVYIAKRSLIEE